MPTGFDPDRRGREIARLAEAQARLARLETIFASDDAIGRLLRDGRYLRLCAAIGRAAHSVEVCRARLASGRSLVDDRRKPGRPGH